MKCHLLFLISVLWPVWQLMGQAGGQTGSCYGFEALQHGDYGVGDSYNEAGRLVRFSALQGQEGSARGSSDNVADGSGKELYLDGLKASFETGCNSGVQFVLGAGGKPQLAVEVNGVILEGENPADLDGSSVEGVVVTVSGNQVELSGPIDSLSIGGVDIYLDDVCFEPCAAACIDFEEETPGTEYAAGQKLFEDGVVMTVDDYMDKGTLTIGNRQRAGHLGNDAVLMDASVAFAFGCASEVSLHFGQYQSGLVFEINGEFFEVDQMTELDGEDVGGVAIRVTANETGIGIIGVLTLSGEINSFSIGGAELAIDHVCHTVCRDPGCVEFELLENGDIFTVGDTITEEFTQILVRRFETATPASVVVGNQNIANGSGLEVVLDRAQLEVRFISAGRVEFRYGRPSGGLAGVRLGVNGSLSQQSSFTQLDGLFLGGALIQVDGTDTQGQVIITAASSQIERILIGGNDLAVDTICHIETTPAGECAGFESLPVGSQFASSSGGVFAIDGLSLSATPLSLTESSQVNDGTITVVNNNLAAHIGKALYLLNAGIDFDIPCMRSPSLRFGDYGDRVNLRINGESVIASSMADLNGTTIGGAGVSIRSLPHGGGHIGLLEISGEVSSFEIAGNNLYIDDFCYEVCLSQPDPLQVGEPRILSAEPLNATQRQVIIDLPVSGSDGTITLQRRENLSGAGMWSPQNGTSTTPPGQPNIRRYTINVPLSPDSGFFRFQITE